MNKREIIFTEANFNFIFGNNNLHYELDKNKVAWFLASEIAKGLGYSETNHMLRMVDNYNKILLPLSNPVVPEIGLDFHAPLSGVCNYQGRRRALNARSTRPEVQQFRYWVVQEVLPSIRMYGMYINSEVIKLLQANPNIIAEYQNQIQQLRMCVQDNQQYVDLGKACINDNMSYNNINGVAYVVTQALGRKIGTHTLIPLLKMSGVLQHVDCKLLPTQKAINQELVRRIYDPYIKKWESVFTNEGISKIIEMVREIFINNNNVVLENQLLYELVDTNN